MPLEEYAPLFRPQKTELLKAPFVQVAEAAYEMLSVMDEEAAAANNKVDLFTSEERFPELFQARQSVADADAALVTLSFHADNEDCSSSGGGPCCMVSLRAAVTCKCIWNTEH